MQKTPAVNIEIIHELNDWLWSGLVVTKRDLHGWFTFSKIFYLDCVTSDMLLRINGKRKIDEA